MLSFLLQQPIKFRSVCYIPNRHCTQTRTEIRWVFDRKDIINSLWLFDLVTFALNLQNNRVGIPITGPEMAQEEEEAEEEEGSME